MPGKASHDKTDTANLIAVAVLAAVVIVVVIMNILNPSAGTASRESSGAAVLGQGFTTAKIVDGESAISAVQDCAEELGLGNAVDELSVSWETSSDDGTVYRLQQCYQGLPVVGHEIVVSADDEGNALDLVSTAEDVDPSLEIELQDATTISDVQKAIDGVRDDTWEDDETVQAEDLCQENLVLFDAKDGICLAYRINTAAHQVIVDVTSGKVLDCTQSIRGVTDSEGNELMGSTGDGQTVFPISYDENTGCYWPYDEERCIGLWRYQWEPVLSEDTVFGNTESEADENQEKGVAIFKAVEDTIDYYASTFGKTDVPYGVMRVVYDSTFDSGQNARGGGVYDEEAGFFSYLEMGSSKYDASDIDVITHEYTHIVLRECNSCQKGNEASAINEGIADIQACLRTNDWKIADLRDISAGRTFSQKTKPGDLTLSFTWGFDEYSYSTIISYAAYKMAMSGAFGSNGDLARLWYRTMIRLPYDCKFTDVPTIMLGVARWSGCTREQIAIIKQAFSEADIYTDDGSDEYDESEDVIKTATTTIPTEEIPNSASGNTVDGSFDWTTYLSSGEWKSTFSDMSISSASYALTDLDADGETELLICCDLAGDSFKYSAIFKHSGDGVVVVDGPRYASGTYVCCASVDDNGVPGIMLPSDTASMANTKVIQLCRIEGTSLVTVRTYIEDEGSYYLDKDGSRTEISESEFNKYSEHLGDYNWKTL